MNSSSPALTQQMLERMLVLAELLKQAQSKNEKPVTVETARKEDDNAQT